MPGRREQQICNGVFEEEGVARNRLDVPKIAIPENRWVGAEEGVTKNLLLDLRSRTHIWFKNRAKVGWTTTAMTEVATCGATTTMIAATE
ncbi:unnamed protein product [Linum trigynum]|uniref:DNA-directed RNA polymerase n=1 Tax=Linum trigynum TaxID=586398 RepID=A0AAV2CU29_9ROSI